ncbi:hypothetical protein R6Q59_027999 [Mikania micrantha]
MTPDQSCSVICVFSNEIETRELAYTQTDASDCLKKQLHNENYKFGGSWIFTGKLIPTVQGSTSKRSKALSTDSLASSNDRVQINLNDLNEEKNELEDLTRPIGGDRAKADRARARRASSSQSIPDYTQGMDNLSQKIGDFNELRQKCQRLVELQLLFTNTDHLTEIDREIA